MARQISKRAFDLCVAHEVTSEAYYKKHYQRPEWPGLSSGVTVGIGYDLGQASRDKIRNDWNGLVSAQMLDVMMDCSGHTGMRGKAKLAQVKTKILIPWEKALHVFANRDVPTWTAGVIRYIPEAANLPPSCLGVLFDLAYNRGHSWNNNSGDRYREMRAIKNHVRTGNIGLVPSEIRSMKRLWPNAAGLLRRCDDRIKLWQYGMNNETPITATSLPTATLDPAVPTSAGPARTKPAATSTAQNTTTTAIVVGGGAGTVKAAQESGPGVAIGIALATLLLAGVVFWAWYRHRNPKANELGL